MSSESYSIPLSTMPYQYEKQYMKSGRLLVRIVC